MDLPLNQRGAFRGPIPTLWFSRRLKPILERVGENPHNTLLEVVGDAAREAYSLQTEQDFRSEAVVGYRTSCLAFSENMSFPRIASEACKPESEFIHAIRSLRSSRRGRINFFLRPVRVLLLSLPSCHNNRGFRNYGTASVVELLARREVI